jgi:hypothetical protein
MRDETASFKGFGKSVAHILCAVFVGRFEFCNSIHYLYGYFRGKFADLWDGNKC